MRLSDIQPQYFPRLHYFARMMASDVFVIRDDVQFLKTHKYPDGSRGSSYQAHTPIKAVDGEQMLSVPVSKKGTPRLSETIVSYDQPWAQKHLNIMRNVYGKAPNFSVLADELKVLLARRYESLAELNIATTCWALGHLLGRNMEPDQVSLKAINSALEQQPVGRLRQIALGSDVADWSNEDATASERIAGLCRTFGADTYIAGRTAAEAYLDRSPFEAAGVEIAIQKWSCGVYPQRFSEQGGFSANLSIIDLLMHVPHHEAVAFLNES